MHLEKTLTRFRITGLVLGILGILVGIICFFMVVTTQEPYLKDGLTTINIPLGYAIGMYVSIGVFSFGIVASILTIGNWQGNFDEMSRKAKKGIVILGGYIGFPTLVAYYISIIVPWMNQRSIDKYIAVMLIVTWVSMVTTMFVRRRIITARWKDLDKPQESPPTSPMATMTGSFTHFEKAMRRAFYVGAVVALISGLASIISFVMGWGANEPANLSEVPRIWVIGRYGGLGMMVWGGLRSWFAMKYVEKGFLIADGKTKHFIRGMIAGLFGSWMVGLVNMQVANATSWDVTDTYATIAYINIVIIPIVLGLSGLRFKAKKACTKDIEAAARAKESFQHHGGRPYVVPAPSSSSDGDRHEDEITIH